MWKCSSLSCVRLFAIPWTIAHQAPLCMEFSRQEYWSGLPCPPPGDLPDPGTEPESHVSYVSFIGWRVLYHWATWAALSALEEGQIRTFNLQAKGNRKHHFWKAHFQTGSSCGGKDEFAGPACWQAYLAGVVGSCSHGQEQDPAREETDPAQTHRETPALKFSECDLRTLGFPRSFQRFAGQSHFQIQIQKPNSEQNQNQDTKYSAVS